jgi:signal transduction histidine kinase
MLALTLVTASLTVLSNYSAQRHFVLPFESLGLGITDIQVTPRYDDLHEAELITAIPSSDNITAIVRASQSNFQIYSIIVAAVFILVGTFFAYIISEQTLKPIKALAAKIEDVDANNLAEPIEPPKQNDEVSRLTHSFNNMLGKLNRSFESQKLFAQNAAHELKTPLAFIRASIDVLQLDNEPSAEEYKDVVDIVKDSTERLIELVEGLLSINSVVDEMQWQTFSGKSIFEAIVNELEGDIARKSLAVNITGDSRITGDKTLLERAFSNLVHNAVRYNVDNGKVNITLANDGIIIEDSGVGIPAEHLTHIFEPFYCVDKSRSKNLGGHGLGMAIAKNIFDRHKMEIRIDSEPGQGTKINLTWQEKIF